MSEPTKPKRILTTPEYLSQKLKKYGLTLKIVFEPENQTGIKAYEVRYRIDLTNSYDIAMGNASPIPRVAITPRGKIEHFDKTITYYTEAELQKGLYKFRKGYKIISSLSENQEACKTYRIMYHVREIPCEMGEKEELQRIL
jgi:hypothetical protein